MPESLVVGTYFIQAGDAIAMAIAELAISISSRTVLFNASGRLHDRVSKMSKVSKLRYDSTFSIHFLFVQNAICLNQYYLCPQFYFHFILKLKTAN